MADTDLSKIVGLIMENPKLIEEIKAIANTSKTEDSIFDSEQPAKTEETEEILTTTEAVMEAEPTIEPIKPTEEAVPQKRGHRARRGELLRALKPYVSSERSKAIESMISITEILDMMRES